MISTFASSLALGLGCSGEGLGPLGNGPLFGGGDIVVSDANNYFFRGTLDGPSTPVAELVDVSFSFSELAYDLQCHDVDPVEDIDDAALMVFPYLSEEEVEAGLETDTLQQVDLAIYLSFDPEDGTGGVLSDFTFFGTEADVQLDFREGSGTWLIVLSSGTQIGVGSRMFAFLEPSSDEVSTHVDIAGGCDVLEHEVDLDALTPVDVEIDGPWDLDFGALESTAQGVEFNPLKISEITVARYDADLADLEEQFLDLELIAEELYRMEHPAGTTADLGDLKSESGEPFTGFEGEGTWLLALQCGTCSNPAPLFLTVLEPVSGE